MHPGQETLDDNIEYATEWRCLGAHEIYELLGAAEEESTFVTISRRQQQQRLLPNDEMLSRESDA